MTGNHGKRMVREDLIKKLEEKVVVAAKVANIKTLTNEQIDSLNCGDIVVKSENGSEHAYIVAYKKSDEMSLVYCDHENIEEVYYEKSGSNWAWVVTDNFNLKNYTAGDNIQIVDGVISATDTTYTAGDNISIENGVISASGGTPSLYRHTLVWSNASSKYSFTFEILSTSSTAFTKTSFQEFASTKYSNKYCLASGSYIDGDGNAHSIEYVRILGNKIELDYTSLIDGQISSLDANYGLTALTLNDIVSPDVFTL